MQIIPLKSTGDISRILLATSSGAVQLWQQDQLQWNREESLSQIVSVEFVDLPERKSVETALDGLGLVSRLTRQAKKAKVLNHLLLTYDLTLTSYGRPFRITFHNLAVDS